MKNTLHALALTLAAFVMTACGDSQTSNDPAEFIKTYVNETLNGDIEKVIAKSRTFPKTRLKKKCAQRQKTCAQKWKKAKALSV